MRKRNEDCYLAVDGRDHRFDAASLGKLFAVADGMSGHRGGAEASRMACEGLLDYYADRSDPKNTANFEDTRLKTLRELFYRVHSKIHACSLEAEGFGGMGTTLSALILLNDAALIAHVGDSRIYRLRNHRLARLTRDHTMAQLSLEMGYIEQKNADNHPMHHVLTSAVGQDMDEFQTGMETVAKGDIFLLCTDGLHNGVSDAKIQEVLEAIPPEKGACDRLVQEAIKGGGRDNITVVAVHV